MSNDKTLDFTKYENKLEFDYKKELTIDEYLKENERLLNLFKQDALKAVGWTKHKKADEIFRHASVYLRGNSINKKLTFIKLKELAELFRED